MIVRILFLLAVICFITKTINGEVANNGTNEFIVGPWSQPVTLGQFPSFVVLNLPQTLNSGLCGGFIVNVNHVVTTGSCVLDANRNLIAPSAITLHVGMHAVPSPLPVAQVNRIFVHPLFNPWTFDNDIAVLRTTLNLPIQEGLIQNVVPSQMNHRFIGPGVQCHLVGLFGGVENVNRPVHHQPMPVVSREKCNIIYSHRVPSSQFCAGFMGTAGACQINRGGPLYCDNQVAGILSNRFSCGTQGNQPGVYTQIRLYIPWITQQMARQDIPVAGSTPAPSFPINGQSIMTGYIGLIVLSAIAVIFGA